MSEYTFVKVAKLKLKGEKSIHKKSKSRKRKPEEPELKVNDDDKAKHGGWWAVKDMSEIKGNVAVQIGAGPTYMKALNQGSFIVGAPHNEGDGPDPEEIFAVVPVGDQLAFKSGYNKYLGVNSKGQAMGIADAVGPREQWELVFQDGKSALLSSFISCFMGFDDEDNIVARSPTAQTSEMITLRCNTLREHEKPVEIPEAEKGKLRDVERNYVKMFQKFQDKRLRLYKGGSAELREAKSQGSLHEALLDRRSKMKSDRYCK